MRSRSLSLGLAWLITMSAGCAFSHRLRVTDVNQRPIAGAEVAVHKSSHANTLQERRIAGQTDVDGRIEIKGIQSGETLGISKAGYRSVFLISRPFPDEIAMETGPGLPE